MGWVIKNGNGLSYRTLEQGIPKWTGIKEKALHFSRRCDAESFAAEDEDAWFVDFVPLPHESGSLFSELTPAELERLFCVVEEFGEALQSIGKIGRHGYESQHPEGGPSNRKTFERELGDVLETMQMLRKAHDVSWGEILDCQKNKQERMKPYLHHQGS